MFKIAYTSRSAAQLAKLPKADARRLAAKIEAFAADPFAPYGFVKRMVGSPHSRIRAGNYRAIVAVIQDRLVVEVIKVGKRGDVYD